VAGFAALGAIQESDKGWWPALKAAAEGALTGGALQVMGPASRPVRLTGAGAMTYAQARLNGADNNTALANATTMGLVAGGPMSPEGGATVKQIGDINGVDLTPRVPPLFPNRNATEKASVDYLRDQGVNVGAGAASGSPFLQHTQKLVDSTLGGQGVYARTNAANTEALQGIASGFVADATPEVSSDTHYGAFRDIESDPANAREVPVRTMQRPITDNVGRPTGKTESVPVMESVQMPVNIGALKPTFERIRDEMSFNPMSQRSDSAAWAAVNKFLDSPDHVPASNAELGLSGFKTEAREGSGRSQALSKFIVPKLQGLIDGTVLDVGGQDALDHLQAGRAAKADEAGADWLTKEFQIAQAEGGFGHSARLWADWQRLNDSAKQTMFTQQQQQDLGKFFLGTKALAQNPNPSGSGVTAAIATQIASLFNSHTMPLGAATIGGGWALSRLLHSGIGVKLLTEGLNMPENSPGGQFIKGRLAGIVGTPPSSPPPGGGMSSPQQVPPDSTPGQQAPPAANPPALDKAANPRAWMRPAAAPAPTEASTSAPAESFDRAFPARGSAEGAAAETGPHGPIFRDFQHDASGAVAKLMKEQSGDAIGALHHPAVGVIDLVWGKAGQPWQKGDDGYGLAHILAKHGDEFDVNKLQGLLDDMQKVPSAQPDRVELQSAKYHAIVRLTWDGAAKRWLATAYDRTEPPSAKGRSFVPGTP